MKRFVAGAARGQSTLLPECLDDWIDESNCVRVIDAFVDLLDLAEPSFERVEPAATGRPAYHPSVLLKLYIYGYLNRVQSSRRLERDAGRTWRSCGCWAGWFLTTNDRRFPQGQRPCYRQGVRTFRRSVPQDGSADESHRRHRR
jgi:hypothetical protein